MKLSFRSAFLLCALCVLCVQVGCSSVQRSALSAQPDHARNVAVQSLKAVGHSAEATVEFSAQLYRDGHITAAQARTIADFFDTRFQPAYRAAVAAARLDLSQPAPAELLNLAQQFTALISSYLPPAK